MMKTMQTRGVSIKFNTTVTIPILLSTLHTQKKNRRKISVKEKQ